MTERTRIQLAVFALIRTIFNTAYRMMYPFLGVFARALGVDLVHMGWALSLRSLVGGALAPFLSIIPSRRGHRAGMLFGLLMFTASAVLVLLWPTYPVLVLSIVLGTLGKYIFDPAMQAYLGERVPYERRGLALATTEMGWSFSFIFGIPLMGFLLARGGWMAPFPALALLGVGTLLALLWLLPASKVRTPRETFWGGFRSVLTSSTAISGLMVGFLASGANEVVNLVFGVWLEDSFALKITALGGAAAVIGLSELGGEGLTALLADRLGKKNAVRLGLLSNALAAALLPILGRSIPGALVGLFFFYITFEFTLVASIPMMTELLPDARATLMAFNITALSLGRAAGAPIGTFSYAYGIGISVTCAILLNGLALLALQYVREAGTSRYNHNV